jgi:hypothetical protein
MILKKLFEFLFFLFIYDENKKSNVNEFLNLNSSYWNKMQI